MNGEIFRGQVYFTDLGQRTGSEQSGMRPVIIVQNDIGNRNSPTVIVVPITSQIKREDMPTHISLRKSFGLDEDSIALCEHEFKNITKTANALFISQPALTARIKQLERELNTTLLHSSNKGIFLTSTGMRLRKLILKMKDTMNISTKGVYHLYLRQLSI